MLPLNDCGQDLLFVSGEVGLVVGRARMNQRPQRRKVRNALQYENPKLDGEALES